jgi:hypothetical protein
MAAHGEKSWPSAGRSDGRHWGGFHGRRHYARYSRGRPHTGMAMSSRNGAVRGMAAATHGTQRSMVLCTGTKRISGMTGSTAPIRGIIRVQRPGVVARHVELDGYAPYHYMDLVESWTVCCCPDPADLAAQNVIERTLSVL